MTKLLALLMLMLIATPVKAVGVNADVPVVKCTTVQKVQEDVATWPHPTVIVSMNRLDTANFLATYNAEPPVSNYTADTSLAIMPINAPVVVWVPFRNGCALVTLTFTKTYFMSILNRGEI